TFGTMRITFMAAPSRGTTFVPVRLGRCRLRADDRAAIATEPSSRFGTQRVLPGRHPPATVLLHEHVQRHHGVPDIEVRTVGVDGPRMLARDGDVGPEELDICDLVAGPLAAQRSAEQPPAGLAHLLSAGHER